MDHEKPSTHEIVNENGDFGQFDWGNPVGVPYFPYAYAQDPNRSYFGSPVPYYGYRHVTGDGDAAASDVQNHRQFGPFIGISPFGPTFGFGFGLPLFPRPFYPYPFFPRPYWWW